MPIMNEDKKQMIEKLADALKSEANFIREDNTTPDEIKLSQMDVVLDVYHFLMDYENNVKILNQYNLEHRFDRKFKSGLDDDKVR